MYRISTRRTVRLVIQSLRFTISSFFAHLQRIQLGFVVSETQGPFESMIIEATFRRSRVFLLILLVLFNIQLQCSLISNYYFVGRYATMSHARKAFFSNASYITWV